ncbi:MULTISPECIES: DUF4113 domain-containing protein [Acinetobacter calcoaceticus/baumannii complex]|uniref:DUF4113 domain-containing protein n=1 Tax=Acinetobacter calcoaceticus/baumannii complex TaxID=909768 RepID=UPI0026DFAAC8|nr:DUF4113 domain-containing protein [Acinetobacter nosocomialis]
MKPRVFCLVDVNNCYASIDLEKTENLMCAIEGIQEKFGKFKLGFGGSMYQNRSWSMSQNLKSNNYFTWEGMLTISK